jgi:hypothetical protein
VTLSSVTSFVEQDKPCAKKQKISKINHRKYDEAYIEWGFSCMPDGLQPLCVIRDVMLSSNSMKPSLLQRHFNLYHNSIKGKSKDFFSAKRQDLSTQQATLKTNVNISSKCLQAPYVISLCAAMCKTSHIVVQELVVPSAIEIASVMFDDKIVSQIKAIPCSDNIVQRRIVEMVADVTDKVVEKIVLVKQFAFQLGESMDISNEAELVAFVRVPDKVEIVEHILFCNSLKRNANGRAVFEVINDFFNEQKVKWQWCEAICTDGIAAMTGRLSGLVLWVRKENNTVLIHRQALASKKLNLILRETLTDAVNTINSVKSRPLNTRFFHQLCAQMDSEHTDLKFGFLVELY